jgi:hypothetical protein
MKNLSNFSVENIKAQLEENKELTVPVIVLLVSLFLFVIFILPNILSFPSKKGERDVEIAKLNQIREAKKVLQNSDNDQLSSQVDLTSNTLPSDKNFEIILGAISEAATKSNTQIAGYQFSDSGESKILSPNSIPTVDFIVSIVGGLDQASAFVDQLYATSPISEVTGISYSDQLSKINVSFFYKPFTSLNSADVALARERNSKENQALIKISQWDSAVNSGDVETPNASVSASPF